MTREEAIYKAKHLRKVHPSICIDAEDFWETVIAALEQEPCKDAISREAVLDLCDSKDEEYKVRHFREDVECLPPVQPKLVECEDCVSRDAVLEALYDHEYKKDIRKDIEALPSVTPAEKVGRWIANGETFRCSECGELACCQGRYCNECGAKMQEVDDNDGN